MVTLSLHGNHHHLCAWHGSLGGQDAVFSHGADV